MFCPNCGTQNTDAAQACVKCAFALKNGTAAKFKGTMLMMNPPGPGVANVPPPRPGSSPQVPPSAPESASAGFTAEAPPLGFGAPAPAPAPAPVPDARSKLKGTIVGVAPPNFASVAGSAQAGGVAAAPAAPASASTAVMPRDHQSFGSAADANPLAGTMAIDAPPFGSPLNAPNPPAPHYGAPSFNNAPPPVDFGAPPPAAPQGDPYAAPAGFFGGQSAPEQQSPPGGGFGAPHDPYGQAPAVGMAAAPYGTPPQDFGAPAPMGGANPNYGGYAPPGQPSFNQGMQGYPGGPMMQAGMPGMMGMEQGGPPKQFLITLLLCIFAGGWGAHRFYSGHIVYGVIQFLTCGGLGIWWLIDLFLIVTGKYTDAQGRPLAKS